MKFVWCLAVGLVGAGLAVGCSRPSPAVQPGVSLTADKPAAVPVKAEAACEVKCEDGEKEEGEEGEEGGEEEGIAIDKLPAGISQAALAAAPGFTAVKAQRAMTKDGAVVYVLMGTMDGKPAAVAIGADGKVLKVGKATEADEDGEENEDEEGEENEGAEHAKGKGKD